ncbi:MAG TPA: 16S rRNA (cytosine(1402)-N(4))-methyltransferase RsmH [Candidatus Cryptobacteroides pullicola]|nr:16S rRNA (cytosine(1402)-N(4))-methyltransferase RsmH [Candidatus Cryptobacteroides pullicola]
MSEYHIPVLLHESVDALVTDPAGLYADATFGGGSHSREILSRLGPEGRLFAFDRDADALANAPEDTRITLIHNNFRFIHNYMLLECRSTDSSLHRNTGNSGCRKTDAAGQHEDGSAGYPETGEVLDGVLADLGVSSHQFDTAGRGFSFRYSAALDMRMNAQGGKTAADIVNSYTQEELERILRLFGEVDNARRLAQLIVAARTKAPVLTTDDLYGAIRPALPSFAEHKYLAKVYQAFRIEVNDEMRSLEKFLYGAAASLKKGGRLVVITYHSLEDRMVKNFIRSGNVDGIIEKDTFGVARTPLRAVNRKPVLPSEEEIASNTRARSAKLRIAEKI